MKWRKNISREVLVGTVALATVLGASFYDTPLSGMQVARAATAIPVPGIVVTGGVSHYTTYSSIFGQVDYYWYSGDINLSSRLPVASSNVFLINSSSYSNGSSSDTYHDDYSYGIVASPGDRLCLRSSHGIRIPGVPTDLTGVMDINDDNDDGDDYYGVAVVFTMPSTRQGGIHSGYSYSYSHSSDSQVYSWDWVCLPILSLGDPSAEQASVAQQAVSIYNVTNSTSITDIRNLVNSVVDTSKYYTSVSETGHSYATESTAGNLSGSVTITQIDNPASTTTVAFNNVISMTGQSLGTIATSLNSFCTNYSARNGSQPTDFTSAVAITNPNYHITVGAWNLVPATPSTNGSLTGTVYIMQGSTPVWSYPISKTISKLADTATIAKSEVNATLQGYKFTNATTDLAILNLAENVVNTNFVTITGSGYSKTPATETTQGNFKYTLSISDTVGGTTSIVLDVPIAIDSQSIATVSTLYTNYINSMQPSNSTSAPDLLNAVLITNQGITSKVENFINTPATDITEGSLKANIIIQQLGQADMLVPVDKVIPRLSETSLTAKQSVLTALSTFNASNTTPQSTYEDLIKSCIDELKVSYTITNYLVEPATESNRGLITGVITLTDSNNVVENINIYSTIEYLSESVQTVKSQYSARLSKFIPLNITSANGILGLVDISNADIKSEMLSYLVDPAIDTREGRITGVIKITNTKTGETDTLSVYRDIPVIEQELATAVNLAQNYLSSYTPTNTTSFTNLVNSINSTITNPDINASWDYGTTNTPEQLATETEKGLIDKTLVLTNSSTGLSVTVPVYMTIPKLSYTVAGVSSLLDVTINSYVATNYTSGYSLESSLINSVDDLASSNVTIKVVNFAKDEATETEKGSITADVIVSDGTLINTISVSREIDLVPQTIQGVSDLLTSACSSIKVLNSTTSTSLLGDFNKLLTNALGSKISLYIDEANFSLVKSTMDSTGLINTTVEIVDNNAVKVNLPLTIQVPRIPQTVEDALEKIKVIISKYKVSDLTTSQDLLNSFNTVKTGANGSVLDININNANIVNSSDSSDGVISGEVLVEDNFGNSASYQFSLAIARTDKKLTNGVTSEIASILAGLDTSTIRSLDDLNKLIDTVRIKHPQANTDSSSLVFVASSTASDGSITGNIVVTVGAESKVVPVNIVIQRTDKDKADGLADEISKIIAGLDPSLIKTKDDLDKALEKIKDEHPETIIDTGKIVVTSPSGTGNGSITGDITVTVGTSSGLAPINIVIPADTATKLDVISQEITASIIGGNIKTKEQYVTYISSLEQKYPDITFDVSKVLLSDSGAKGVITLSKGEASKSADINFIFHKYSGGSSSGSSGGALTEPTIPTTGVVTTVDKSSEKSIDATGLKSIFGITGNVTATSYTWSAYKDSVLVNSGTLDVAYLNDKILGASVNANSPLDSETNVDIALLGDASLNTVYVFNTDVSKYVHSNIPVVAIDGKLVFTGNNKSQYILSAGVQVNNPNFIENGWYTSKESSKYLVENTDCKTGWVNSSDAWFYLNGITKSAETGWVNQGGTWYYLSKDQVDLGTMHVGWLSDNNSWYYLNPVSNGSKGAMRTGWIYTDNNWYYLNSSGTMVTGWQQVSSTWYYLNNDGSMAHDTDIDGYQLGSDGALI